MTEPEIQIKAHTVLLSAARELVEQARSLAPLLARAVHGKDWPGRPVLGPPHPPDLWLTLLRVNLDPTARAVLDLHHPEPDMRLDGSAYWWHCAGCDPGLYAEDNPDWPCRTVELIAERSA